MRRGAWSLTLILVVLLQLAPSGALAATYSFAPIDVPFVGVTDTLAFGVNNAAQIVGYYADAAGSHGFLDGGGVFTALPFPADVDNKASGISSGGQIVGQFTDAAGVHGFLDNGGAFTTINALFAGVTTTRARGINAGGQIVGSYTN